MVVVRTLLCLWGAWTLAVTAASAEDAHIAVAANFQNTAQKLVRVFEARSPHTIELSIAGTGQLYAQIKNGAPFDGFLAADHDTPARLVQQGYAIAGTQRTYARGELVLWAPGRDEVSAETIRTGSFMRLAIAHPELAPYGMATNQVLDALLSGDRPHKRLVTGMNIAQTFTYVKTGNADVGFIAKSQYLMIPAQDRGGSWSPPPSLYAPILQDLVLLRHGQHNEAATKFLDFLTSAEAKEIIRQDGYKTK